MILMDFLYIWILPEYCDGCLFGVRRDLDHAYAQLRHRRIGIPAMNLLQVLVKRMGSPHRP